MPFYLIMLICQLWQTKYSPKYKPKTDQGFASYSDCLLTWTALEFGLRECAGKVVGTVRKLVVRIAVVFVLSKAFSYFCHSDGDSKSQSFSWLISECLSCSSWCFFVCPSGPGSWVPSLCCVCSVSHGLLASSSSTRPRLSWRTSSPYSTPSKECLSLSSTAFFRKR